MTARVEVSGSAVSAPAAAPSNERAEREHARLWHIYARIPAPVGDRALCGWIKRDDSGVRHGWQRPDSCVVCWDLWNAGYGP